MINSLIARNTDKMERLIIHNNFFDMASDSRNTGNNYNDGHSYRNASKKKKKKQICEECHYNKSVK